MDQPGGERVRYTIDPDASAVLIHVRSNVGAIEFGATGLVGFVDAVIREGAVDMTADPRAHIELEVDQLQSGNQLYDAELLRRIGARRFPVVQVDLAGGTRSSDNDRYQLAGQVTFHGIQRPVSGAVTVSLMGTDKLAVDGEHPFDIRDFDVPTPSMLMLKIYPDVRVQLHVEAGVAR